MYLLYYGEDYEDLQELIIIMNVELLQLKEVFKEKVSFTVTPSPSHRHSGLNCESIF